VSLSRSERAWDFEDFLLHVCTSFAPELHRSCTGKVQNTEAEERGRSEYSIERRENSLSLSLSHNSILHRNGDAHITPDGPAAVGECVCDPRLSAHTGNDWGEVGWILNQGLKGRPFGCIPEVQRCAIRCKSANLGGVPPPACRTVAVLSG